MINVIKKVYLAHNTFSYESNYRYVYYDTVLHLFTFPRLQTQLKLY